MSERRSGHEALVDALADLGVTKTFGLIGEDTAALTADLSRRGIDYFSAAHENVAVNMADGYAWASGALGVAIVSRGPGLTNALTALGTAARGRRKVLVITGDSPASNKHHDRKRVDQRSLAATIGLNVVFATSSTDLGPAFQAAVTAANGGSATLLGVPLPVMLSPAQIEPLQPSMPAETQSPVPRPEDIDEVASLLKTARTPLILAGRGASSTTAKEALQSLAEATGALLGTTLLAKDLFREHRHDVGIVGGFAQPANRRVIEEVDFVLAMGTSLSRFTTAGHRLFTDIPVAQVDTQPAALGAESRITHGILAESAAFALALLDLLLDRKSAASPPRSLGDLDGASPFESPEASTAETVDPRSLLMALDRLLPADRTIVADGGHSSGFPATHMRVPGPRHYMYSVDFGSIGMGVGTALGASLGRPESQVVAIVGDGAASMVMGDLATAVRYQVPVLLVVMNDAAFGAERHFMDLMSLPNEHSLLPRLDFGAIARAIDLEAIVIHSVRELEAAASDLSILRERPLLLDCRINGEVMARWLREF
jgi:thiamine pyrophosphate-dependent acetolactate synthase large subunit-like protein